MFCLIILIIIDTILECLLLLQKGQGHAMLQIKSDKIDISQCLKIEHLVTTFQTL